MVVHDKAKDRQYEQPYDALILSPGAEPVRPPIPGADHKRVFTLRSLADMDAIKAAVRCGRGSSPPSWSGGGYIGLEMTEALAHRGLAVSLVELEAQVMGPIDPEMATPLHEHLRLQGRGPAPRQQRHGDSKTGTASSRCGSARAGSSPAAWSSSPSASGRRSSSRPKPA